MEITKEKTSLRGHRYVKRGVAGLVASLACLVLSFLLSGFEWFEYCFSNLPYPVSGLTITLFNILFLAGIVGLFSLLGLFLFGLLLLVRRQAKFIWVLLASGLALFIFGAAIFSSANGMRVAQSRNQ